MQQGAEDQAFEKKVQGKRAAAKKRAARRSKWQYTSLWHARSSIVLGQLLARKLHKQKIPSDVSIFMVFLYSRLVFNLRSSSNTRSPFDMCFAIHGIDTPHDADIILRRGLPARTVRYQSAVFS